MREDQALPEETGASSWLVEAQWSPLVISAFAETPVLFTGAALGRPAPHWAYKTSLRVCRRLPHGQEGHVCQEAFLGESRRPGPQS